MNFVEKLYEIPELTEINRLPMHGAEIPFPDPESAMTREYTNSPWYRSLDGKWGFTLYHTPDEIPEDILSPSWTPGNTEGVIKVPSNWTLAELFDKPVYTNSRMPAGSPPPPRTPEENPTGIYRKKFRIPSSWKERHTILHIGGAESYLEVYVNGHFAGMGKDTRLPSEFDITPWLLPGENLLVCKVIRWSDSSFIEDQDQWWMAGIYRSVYLYSTGDVLTGDLFVNGDYDEKNGNGTLNVSVQCAFRPQNISGSPGYFGNSCTGPVEDHRVTVELFDREKRTVFKEEQQLSHAFRESNYIAEFRNVLPGILPWSAEKPVLYTLVVSLFDGKGRLIECRSKRTGFRNIRIEGRDLLFNGKRVLIRGVNRHEHSMTGGKTLSMEEMLQDIRLLKQYNFNAVRTSHYPCDHRWYDLCDEYGIYVLDEANLESHGCYATLCRDPRWRNAWITRGERMVLRDRSHVSIFGWSTGNESGNGENHTAQIHAMLALDNTRTIHHEGELKEFWNQPGNLLKGGQKELNNYFNPMYPAFDVLERYGNDPDSDRPCILSEYSHAMGNSCGALCHYWDLFYTLPGLQGGFIWDWIDQGLKSKNVDGKSIIAYGGDFGEAYHDFDFCCNGLIAADRRVHPHIFEFRHLAQGVKITQSSPEKLVFCIENRRDFSTLEDLRGVWHLEIDGEVCAAGEVPGFRDLTPGEKKLFTLTFPGKQYVGKEAFINFDFTLAQDTPWAEKGTLLAHDQIGLAQLPGLLTAPVKKSVNTRAAVKNTPGKVWLCNGENAVVFDRKKEQLQFFCSGKKVMAPLFTCHLFRVPTDNDGVRGWTPQPHKPLYHWLAAGLDRLECVETRFEVSDKNKKSMCLTAYLTGSDPAERICFKQKITAEHDGTFTCSQEFLLPAGFPTMPRIGVTGVTEAGFEDVTWFGRGPWENYSDRSASARVGRFASTVSGMYEKSYVLPQENGNRTGCREVTLSSKEHFLKITAETPFEFSVSHYSDRELFNARHQSELKKEKAVYLHLDLLQRGVGTGSCGPQTLPAYCIDGKKYKFVFSLTAGSLKT